jgi:predicted small metal-binding protein
VKEFSCEAVVPGCSATFEGETEESILQQVAIHAREAHGMTEVAPEVVDQVRAGIPDQQAGE